MKYAINKRISKRISKKVLLEYVQWICSKKVLLEQVQWTCPKCGHRNEQLWFGREYHWCWNCGEKTDIK